MKKLPTLLLLLLAAPTFGTHLVGGTIQVRQVSLSALTYEITVLLYMDAGSTQQDEILVCPGDGSQPLKVARESSMPLERDKRISYNRYRLIHTYNAPAVRTVSVQLANRSESRNIAGSQTTPFYLETSFNSEVVNNTPTFPVLTESFYAAVNQKATYNLSTVDAEGDSVAYYLIPPQLGECGKTSAAAPQYIYPNDVTRKGRFFLDSRTGDLTWDAPTEAGRYTFTAVAEEWRKKPDGTTQRISRSSYDMSIVAEDRQIPPGTIPPYEPVLERGVLTGVENRMTDGDVSIAIYPVPSNERFQVILKSARPTAVTFQLYDIQGRLINEIDLTKQSLEHEQTLETSHLRPGTYLLRTYAQDRLYTSKIIKR